MDRTKKILISLLVLGALAAVGTGTYATFNATTANQGNTFQSGTILLNQTQNVAATCFSYGAAGVIAGSNGANNNNCGANFTLGGATTKTSDVPGVAGLIFQNTGSIAATTFQAKSSVACASNHPTANTSWGSGNFCSDLMVGLQEETARAVLGSAMPTVGNPVTTISIAPTTLGQNLPNGSLVMVVNAAKTNSQVFVTSGSNLTGATAVNVVSQNSNASYTTADSLYLPAVTGCYVGVTQTVGIPNANACDFDSTTGGITNAVTAPATGSTLATLDAGVTLTGGLGAGAYRFFALGVALLNSAGNTDQGLCLGSSGACGGYTLNWTIQ